MDLLSIGREAAQLVLGFVLFIDYQALTHNVTGIRYPLYPQIEFNP